MYKNIKLTFGGNSHIATATSMMAPLCLIFALIIQSSFIYANEGLVEEFPASQEVLTSPTDADDEMIKDFRTQTDWMEFMSPNSNLYPSSSAAMMTQATSSNKTVEEQLEDIKSIDQKMTQSIQSEIANVLALASKITEKENPAIDDVDDNQMRKRSVETPMDSTQLVMRLLKHIKSNNEYQNIAIDKMMTAQEIADKYNIPFNPDPEMLSDLVVASNDHAKELNTMLISQASDMKNITEDKITFVPVEEEGRPNKEQEKDAYYVYAVSYPDDEVYNQQQALPPHEYKPQQISSSHHNHHDHPSYGYHDDYPYETQIPSPPHHHHIPPVSQKPSFYDMFAPSQDYYSEPVLFTKDFEDIEEPQPELIGEEFEETVTSKVVVDRGDEPGSATVNHIMTHTVSEKSNFKTPQIEKLPQQVQYCFLLI